MTNIMRESIEELLESEVVNLNKPVDKKIDEFSNKPRKLVAWLREHTLALRQHPDA